MQATRNGIHFKSAAEAEANEFPVALIVGSSLHAPGFALQKLTEDTQVFLFFDFGHCLPATRVGNVFKSEGLHDFDAPPLVISEFVPYETPAEPGFVDEFFRLEACEHFFLLRCTESERQYSAPEQQAAALLKASCVVSSFIFCIVSFVHCRRNLSSK